MELLKTPRIINTRLYFIDNIRVFLTVLVIFHHVAITYGADGSWYYLEHTQNTIFNSVLSNFTGFNQIYFMSLFFLIAGYFTPGSYDRKGTGSFLKERFLRLGIPLLVFFFVLSPIVEYIKDVTLNKVKFSFWEFYQYNILIKFNLCPGPLWFVETLLVFSVIYAIWRLSFANVLSTCEERKDMLLTNKKVIIFIMLLSLVTFAVRTVFPVGTEYFHLQLGYYPHYISLFIMGIVIYRKDWISDLSGEFGKRWIGLTLAVIIFIGLIIEPILFSVFYTEDKLICGGFTWQSLLHSSFESFGCVGMCITLLYIFQKKMNSQKSAVSKLLARNAYTVYIIHAPIIVVLALLVKDRMMHPLIKLLIVSVIGSFICFFVSQFIIRKLPYIKKVL